MKALQEYEDTVKILKDMSNKELLDAFSQAIWDCSVGSGDFMTPYLTELNVRLETLQKHYQHTKGDECSICWDEE